MIRYLVKHVSQFPSDSELTRYINTLSDPDHAKKCEKCVEAVITAKEEQANKAIKNADKLLEEIDAEKVKMFGVELKYGGIWYTVFILVPDLNFDLSASTMNYLFNTFSCFLKIVIFSEMVTLFISYGGFSFGL